MYLYCYARSEKARETGKKLLKSTEGEWISSVESFVDSDSNMTRADGAIVLILPLAAAVKLLMDNIYKSTMKCPVFMVDSDARFAGVLRREGYNDYDMLMKICDITGAKALTQESDRQEFAPDLIDLATRYNMATNKPELLKTIAKFVADGGNIDIYTDMPVTMVEPTLDNLSYSLYSFRDSQKVELSQAYAAAANSDRYAVFITTSVLPDMDAPNVAVLIPRLIVLGLEFNAKTDADYAWDKVHDILIKHSINPIAVDTIAVSSMLMNTDAATTIADKLQSNKLAYDSRMLKDVRLPLKATYSQTRMDADTCTAAACLASSNGRILFRRAGDKNAVVLTAAIRKGNIELTK